MLLRVHCQGKHIYVFSLMSPRYESLFDIWVRFKYSVQNTCHPKMLSWQRMKDSRVAIC